MFIFLIDNPNADYWLKTKINNYNSNNTFIREHEWLCLNVNNLVKPLIYYILIKEFFNIDSKFYNTHFYIKYSVYYTLFS